MDLVEYLYFYASPQTLYPTVIKYSARMPTLTAWVPAETPVARIYQFS